MEHLRSQTSPTSDGRIAVSGEAIKQFAYIENEQIARSRVRAAAESVSAPKSEFSVLSSRAVLRKKADLEPGERLKVEETLAALMLQPKPPGVQVDPSGRWSAGSWERAFPSSTRSTMQTGRSE
jgi:hypothetical protein